MTILKTITIDSPVSRIFQATAAPDKLSDLFQSKGPADGEA